MPRILPSRPDQDQSRLHIGLDLAKKETQLAALDSNGNLVASRRFPTTRDNISQLCSEFLAGDTVALEVTTNAFSIARMLLETPARVTVSNPMKTRLIAEAKVNTDKIDARILAELDRANYLPPVWVPDPDTEELRRLMSDRQSLVDRRTELKNRIHSVLHRNLIEYVFSDLFGDSGRANLEAASTDVPKLWDLGPLERLRIRSMLEEITDLDRRVGQQEGVIAAFIVPRKELLKPLDRLLSVPGISLVVGAGLLAAIGDISRFRKPRKLASYFGLTPSTAQTGKPRYFHGPITKRGRSQARWLLIEAAEHLRKAPGPMRAFFDRIARKRGHNVAVVAVARKLAELVWRLLTKDEDYYYLIPQRTVNKRAFVRQLARQHGVKAQSATPNRSRSPLYGSGLEGKKIKLELIRQAAQFAEDTYSQIADAYNRGERITRPAGFDPTRPQAIDWQKVLESFAAAMGHQRSRKNSSSGDSSKQSPGEVSS